MEGGGGRGVDRNFLDGPGILSPIKENASEIELNFFKSCTSESAVLEVK